MDAILYILQCITPYFAGYIAYRVIVDRIKVRKLRRAIRSEYGKEA